jgi:hypothetical protein
MSLLRIAAAAATVIVSLPFAGQAMAMQDAPTWEPTRQQQQQVNDRQSRMESERIQNQTSRNNSRYDRNNRNNRNNRQPTPEESIAAAQALATATSLSCQVTEANRVGFNDENQPLYEAACATGPGYILIASEPAQAFDCIELKGQADQARARDPNADVGQQCVIPKNIDTVAVVQGYATQAGVTCTVDQAAVLGKSADGAIVYEAGCASAPGYWLARLPSGGWEVTECLQAISTGGKCQFTTDQEIATGFQGTLANSDASDCVVQQVRLMGQNPNGRFYEAKCAAGDGYVVRVKDRVAEQVYACSIAQGIGGGCTLTPVAAAPAAGAAPTTEQN